MTKYSGILSQLEKEISKLNDHMPRTKKSLATLLTEKSPAFTTREGQASAIRCEELEILAKQIPPKYHKEVKLPFTILRRTSLGPGAHTIGGTKLEQFIVLQILEKINAPFNLWRETELPRIIYSPEVALLRQKLQTTLMIGFGT